MTQKSEGRKQRDAIKNMKCDWNELDGLKAQLISQFSVFTVIDDLYRNNNIMAFIEPANREQLDKDIETLASDINKIGVEMKSIHEQYQGKTGKITDEKEYFSFIAIGEAYIKQATLIEASILPTFQNIMGIFQVAEEKMNAAVAAAADKVETPVTQETEQTA